MSAKRNPPARRLVLHEDPAVVAELERRAAASGRSISAEVRKAVRVYLSDETYSSIADVILEAAERIRRQQGAA